MSQLNDEEIKRNATLALNLCRKFHNIEPNANETGLIIFRSMKTILEIIRRDQKEKELFETLGEADAKDFIADATAFHELDMHLRIDAYRQKISEYLEKLSK